MDVRTVCYESTCTISVENDIWLTQVEYAKCIVKNKIYRYISLYVTDYSIS